MKSHNAVVLRMSPFSSLLMRKDCQFLIERGKKPRSIHTILARILKPFAVELLLLSETTFSAEQYRSSAV